MTFLQTINDAAQTVVSTLEVASAIPFVSVEFERLDELQAVAEDLNQITETVSNLESILQERGQENLGTLSDAVSTVVDQVKDALNQISAKVTEFTDRLAVARTNLANFAASVGQALNLIALAVTFIVLWLIFSQFAVIYVAWGYFKRQGQPAPAVVAPAAAPTTPVLATPEPAAAAPAVAESEEEKASE